MLPINPYACLKLQNKRCILKVQLQDFYSIFVMAFFYTNSPNSDFPPRLQVLDESYSRIVTSAMKISFLKWFLSNQNIHLYAWRLWKNNRAGHHLEVGKSILLHIERSLFCFPLWNTVSILDDKFQCWNSQNFHVFFPGMLGAKAMPLMLALKTSFDFSIFCFRLWMSILFHSLQPLLP